MWTQLDTAPSMIVEMKLVHIRRITIVLFFMYFITLRLTIEGELVSNMLFCHWWIVGVIFMLSASRKNKTFHIHKMLTATQIMANEANSIAAIMPDHMKEQTSQANPNEFKC